MKYFKNSKITNNEKGITLIVLIVTIVVLLVLAGVTVAHITGGDGIIEQASSVQFKTEISDLRKRINIELTNHDEFEFSGSINDLLKEDNKYSNILTIEDGNLVYIDNNVSDAERESFEELGIPQQSKFYTVEFNIGKNEEPIIKRVKSGNKVQIPKNYDSYFQGWYYMQESGSESNPTYTELPFDSNTIINTNYNIYAKYFNEAVMMKRNTTKSYWQSKYSPYVSSILFTKNSNKIPSQYLEKENISENSSAAPIYSYIVDKSTNDDDTDYGVIIYSPNTIYCNPNAGQYFYSLSNLVSIDFDNFDTSKAKNMMWMFRYCSNLKNLQNTNTFNTKNVINMSVMFSGCSSLSELDLSSFDTQNVTITNLMFSACSNLTTIYASSKFSTLNVSNSVNMFYGCSKLVGGNNTKFASAHRDSEYARIDDPDNGKPGYFTLKEN